MLLAWWHHCSKLWIMCKMEKSLLFLYWEWIQKKLLFAPAFGPWCSSFGFSFLMKECRKPKLPWRLRIRIKVKEILFQILFFICYYNNIFKYCPYSPKFNDSYFRHLRWFKQMFSMWIQLFVCSSLSFLSGFMNCDFIIHKPGMDNQLCHCDFDRQTKKGLSSIPGSPLTTSLDINLLYPLI